jgi:hypothetical protein
VKGKKYYIVRERELHQEKERKKERKKERERKT